MDKKKHKSDPYILVIFNNTITLFQVYFSLNIFTRVFEAIPDIAMEDLVDAADYLLILNIYGVISALAYDKEDLTIEPTKFNTLNTFFLRLIPFTQFTSIISVVLAVVTTPLLYLGGYEEVVANRGIRALVAIIVLVGVFFISFLYYYIRAKLKK